MVKKKLLMLSIFTAFFYACDKDTEEFNNDVEALENLTESNATATTTKVIPFGDFEIRGWDWDEDRAVASFVEYNRSTNRMLLHIGRFNGDTYTDSQDPIDLGGNDDIRSWSWDGVKASYHAVVDGQTFLFRRFFDGTTLSPNYTKTHFSDIDDILALDINQTIFRYLALNPKDGNIYSYRRLINPFSGEICPIRKENIKVFLKGSEGLAVTSWSLSPSFRIHHTHPVGNPDQASINIEEGMFEKDIITSPLKLIDINDFGF